jgi:hypothetical protein
MYKQKEHNFDANSPRQGSGGISGEETYPTSSDFSEHKSDSIATKTRIAGLSTE